MGNVLVSSCSGKLPQLHCLKTGQSYYLTEVQHGCHWAKVKMSGGLHFFTEALGENPFPCLFQLLDAALIFWLVATLPPPSKPAMSHLSDISLITFLSNPSQERLSTFKDLCHQTGPTQIIQENLPFSKCVITSVKSLLPCNTFIDSRDSNVDTFGGRHSAFHREGVVSRLQQP